MFSSSKNTSEFSNAKAAKIDTIIGPSTKMQGNITGIGTIRIDGSYTGDIDTETDVIVGESGDITGNIKCVNVTISGKVHGNIKCTGLVEILPTGQLIGDIDVKNVSINTGAIFKGNCVMLTKDDKDEPLTYERNTAASTNE